MPIFDQGYQHWNGTLSGHAWRWLAVTRHGVRIGIKGIFSRLFLLLALLPAAGLVVAISIWGLIERNASFLSRLRGTVGFDEPAQSDGRRGRTAPSRRNLDDLLPHSSFRGTDSLDDRDPAGRARNSSATTCDSMPCHYICRDRCDGSIIFTGKLGVIATFLGLVIVVPSLIAYTFGLLFSLDMTILRDTYRLLLASLAYGAVIILSAGMLILALSSLSRNSRYVALFWLAVWIISAIVGIILNVTDQNQRRQASYNRGWQHQQRHGPLTTRTARTRSQVPAHG